MHPSGCTRGRGPYRRGSYRRPPRCRRPYLDQPNTRRPIPDAPATTKVLVAFCGGLRSVWAFVVHGARLQLLPLNLLIVMCYWVARCCSPAVFLPRSVCFFHFFCTSMDLAMLVFLFELLVLLACTTSCAHTVLIPDTLPTTLKNPRCRRLSDVAAAAAAAAAEVNCSVLALSDPTTTHTQKACDRPGRKM